MMRNGVCSALASSALLTSATAFGSSRTPPGKPWATPTAKDGNSSSSTDGQTLTDGVRGFGNWPTPDASASERINQSPSAGAAERPTLALAAKQWATPRAEDGERGEGSQHDGLMEDAKRWSTPTVDDANNVTRDSGSLSSLARDSFQWSTPSANDAKNCSLPPSQMDRDGLAGQVSPFAGMTPPRSAEPMEPSASSPSKRLKKGLNPRFGLWLMGYPVEWLSCVLSAMPSSRSVRTSGRTKGSTS